MKKLTDAYNHSESAFKKHFRELVITVAMKADYYARKEAVKAQIRKFTMRITGCPDTGP